MIFPRFMLSNNWIILRKSPGRRDFKYAIVSFAETDKGMRLNYIRRFGECGVPVDCYDSQIHSHPEW